MPGRVTKENLRFVFTYQEADDEQLRKYAAVRNAAIALAETILDVVPDCADRSTAIRKLRECRMDANAAIALNGEI